MNSNFLEIVKISVYGVRDFRMVRQSFFYLGGKVSNDDRIDALKNECEIKTDSLNSDEKRIGF